MMGIFLILPFIVLCLIIVFARDFIIEGFHSEITINKDYHDELYWNITGNYWATQIKKASARVFYEQKG